MTCNCSIRKNLLSRYLSEKMITLIRMITLIGEITPMGAITPIGMITLIEY